MRESERERGLEKVKDGDEGECAHRGGQEGCTHITRARFRIMRPWSARAQGMHYILLRAHDERTCVRETRRCAREKPVRWLPRGLLPRDALLCADDNIIENPARATAFFLLPDLCHPRSLSLFLSISLSPLSLFLSTYFHQIVEVLKRFPSSTETSAKHAHTKVVFKGSELLVIMSVLSRLVHPLSAAYLRFF